MFIRQKFTFDTHDNIMADNFSKVYYNNLQGSPDPGRAPFMSFFFFLALTRWLSYQRLFMRKICSQERSAIYIFSIVWIDLTTQPGTWSKNSNTACKKICMSFNIVISSKNCVDTTHIQLTKRNINILYRSLCRFLFWWKQQLFGLSKFYKWQSCIDLFVHIGNRVS